MLRLERHALGPRVFVFGRRIHEWHLGVGILVFLAVLDVTDVLTGGIAAYAIALVGVWAIAKDWRDITPSRRDTASWTLGLHRPPLALRPTRRADWLPPLASVVVAATAVASMVSALRPDIAWRGHLIRDLTPVHTAAVFHAAVIPVGWALLVASYYLWRRRERAFQIAFALLLVLGVMNVVKGLDVEEALLAWGAAGLLWWGRSSFSVRPGPLRIRVSLGVAGAVALSTLVVSTVAAGLAAEGQPSVDRVLQSTWNMLIWQNPPVAFEDEFRFVPQAIGMLSLLAMLVVAWAVFRPVAPISELPDEAERERARVVVARHGDDALSFFKLRTDKQYLWNRNHSAFIGYRVENGVLLVSGNPVGEDEDVRALMAEAVAWADRHDLRFAVIGASESLRDWCVSEGLRGMYIGDEAVVRPESFSLEGRAIRKVRQSVTRLERAGYYTELIEMHDVSADLLAELEAVSAEWRDGAEERGFSMALDRLGGPQQKDTLVMVARDEHDRVAGFIQFVPHAGSAGMSLAMMRRRPDATNGLMEYLIVRSIQSLGGQGVDEVSLNFAAFGRQLRAPENPLERALGWGLRIADRWFQIERLYRFNAKFSPEWRPRYLIYPQYAALPRCTLAVLWAEGQLPKPALPTTRGVVVS
jgi:lysyl-tRNA synthetase, class II